jgi:hypothetical protein
MFQLTIKYTNIDHSEANNIPNRVARWFVSKPKFTILVCFEGRWFGEILTWFGGKFWFIFGLFEGLLV